LRGVTPEDYFAFEFISDPNISPDGKLVAYVVTKIDRAQTGATLHLDGRRLKAVAGRGSSQRRRRIELAALESRTGKSVAFLSSRPESAAPTSSSAEQPRSQVWLLSMAGGEQNESQT
jgi:dipeptidyl aminopeptidase/acylaminoacyl peptidase